jgi:hypothetical protein
MIGPATVKHGGEYTDYLQEWITIARIASDLLDYTEHQNKALEAERLRRNRYQCVVGHQQGRACSMPTSWF